MGSSSDPLFDRYATMDFSDAKPVSAVPALAALQAEHGGKSRVTMRLDNDVLAIFKARAEMTGGNYQTLINQALRDASASRVRKRPRRGGGFSGTAGRKRAPWLAQCPAAPLRQRARLSVL